MTRAKKAAAVVDAAPEIQTNQIAAVQPLMMPLARLMLSDVNVRQTERDAFVPELADDIAAKGLKQNLIVMRSPAIQEGDWPDHEVIAGGRRFQALRLLQERGLIGPEFPVPVLVEGNEEASATSLSENLHRVAMNPVDELLGYRSVVDTIVHYEKVSMSEAIAACARRFGKTVRHIEQRLRLAALADPILEALRSRMIGLEAAQAYAATSDQDAQMQAWRGLMDHARDNLRAVRDALSKTTIASTDRLAIAVGRDAYTKAGGLCERDLFAAEGVETWLDRGLVNRLALDMLKTFADDFQKKKKLSEVRSVLTEYVAWTDYEKLHRIYGKPAANQADHLIRFVLIDRDGALKIDDTVFSSVKEGAAIVDTGDSGPKPMSQGLIDLCALERRDVLAAALSQDAVLCQDLTIFVLAKAIAGSGTYGPQHCVGIKIERQGNLVKGWAPNSIAGEYLDARDRSLSRGWLEAGAPPEQFLAFRLLPHEEKTRWMTYAVAQSLGAAAHNARAGYKTAEESRFFDTLGTMLDVDIRSWWTPTADQYFKRLPNKGALVEALTEMGAEDARGWMDAKKGEIAAECERVAGDYGLTWVPDIMRFPEDLPEPAISEAEDDTVVEQVDEAA